MLLFIMFCLYVSKGNILFIGGFPWKFLTQWQKVINIVLSSTGKWCWVTLSPLRRNLSTVHCPWGMRCESLGRRSFTSQKTEVLNYADGKTQKPQCVILFLEFKVLVVTVVVSLASEFTISAWPAYMSAELGVRTCRHNIMFVARFFFEVFLNANATASFSIFVSLIFVPSFLSIIS